MSKVFNRAPIAIFGILTLIFISAASADQDRFSVVNDPTGFSVLEAGEKGMFNMGPAMGDVVSETEVIANKDVLKFDYTDIFRRHSRRLHEDFSEKAGP